jgi:hypothetical protein
VAVKTGSWEFNRDPTRTAHAWSLGYTDKLAIAVHVGSRADEGALLNRSGGNVFGSGLPNMIMRRVITGTSAG